MDPTLFFDFLLRTKVNITDCAANCEKSREDFHAETRRARGIFGRSRRFLSHRGHGGHGGEVTMNRTNSTNKEVGPEVSGKGTEET